MPPPNNSKPPKAIRKSIRDTYGRKGEEIVRRNMLAVDETLAHLFEVKVPEKPNSNLTLPDPFPPSAPAFERNVLGTIYAGRGDAMLAQNACNVCQCGRGRHGCRTVLRVVSYSCSD